MLLLCTIIFISSCVIFCLVAMLPVQAFKMLRRADFKVLRAVELGMPHFEFVPIDYISRKIKLDLSLTSRILGRLFKLGLVRRGVGAYEGYSLTTWGYDCLALRYLVNSGFLEAIGKPLGVGKEADVYDAITPAGERVAVKFHRLGRVSFRKTRRVRTYIADRDKASWLIQAKMAAKREYEALVVLYSRGVRVPKPIAWNRHVVVMSFIDGDPLYVCDVLPDPEGFLEEVLADIRRSFREAGIVHGDLSEYNVIVTPEIEPLIIDWPQFVYASHPSAYMLLERDVKNIVRFFKRRFRIEVDFREALSAVTG